MVEMENKKNLLKAEKLTKHYKQGNIIVSVLNDVSINFMQGASYAITGISGCGKSTLMHLLAGIDTPSHGHVYYNETSLDKLNPTDKNYFLNQQIGLVFQYSYLIKELTVLENVMIKGLISRMPHDECQKRAELLLQEVGLHSKLHFKPGQLSGGQQQRVALARALLNQPAFLLADEPTGNLDENTGREIVQLLLRLQKELNMGLIVSSHDEYVTQQMQNVYELMHGNLIKKK